MHDDHALGRVPDDVDDPAEYTRIIDAWLAAREWEVR